MDISCRGQGTKKPPRAIDSSITSIISMRYNKLDILTCWALEPLSGIADVFLSVCLVAMNYHSMQLLHGYLTASYICKARVSNVSA